MSFWRSDHCHQWFYGAFFMLLPSLSMVFDGSGSLVKRCDGFDGSLWSNLYSHIICIGILAFLIQSCFNNVNSECITFLGVVLQGPRVPKIASSFQELYPGDLDRLAPHLEVAMNAFPCFQEAEIQVHKRFRCNLKYDAELNMKTCPI